MTDNFIFWVENNNDYKWKIVKYDLSNKNIDIICKYEQFNSIIPVFLTANNSVVTWYESVYCDNKNLNERLNIYDNKNIYIYNNIDDKYIEFEKLTNFFTFMLIDNILYISYLNDDDGNSNIYSINLENLEKKNITKNNDFDTVYYICKLNIDNKLLYEKNINGKVEIFLEK